MNSIGRKNRTKFREQFIKPLLDQRLLQMTVPDKPRSRLRGIGRRPPEKVRSARR